MPRTLFVARHAECLENLKGFISCHMDSALSPEGEKQALELRNRIGDFNPAKVYVSDAIRTQRTARTIFNTNELCVDIRLREIDAGVFSSKKWEDYYKANSESVGRRFLELPRFEQGESYSEVIVRATEFWNDVVLRTSEDLAIIAHGGSVSVLLLCALGLHETSPEVYGVFEISNAEGFFVTIDDHGNSKIRWVKV